MNRTIEAVIAVTIALAAFGIMISLVQSSLYSKANICTGTPPILGEGTIIGSNEYQLNSENKSWVYDLSADGLKPCAWKCETGYQKEGNKCNPASLAD